MPIASWQRPRRSVSGRETPANQRTRRHRMRAPHEDAFPFVRAALDAYTPDACLWASDWPFLKSPVHLDVGPLLLQLERLVPDAAERRRLWRDTPRRWLGLMPR